MKKEEFKEWLSLHYNNQHVISSRISNCETVCTYEGDLDTIFAQDECRDLLNRLNYTADDERNHRAPRHKIPINGNIRNGSATLKQAVNLYTKFLLNEPLSVNKRNYPQIKNKNSKDWPVWNQPDENECYELAKITTKYIKFLNPKIVEVLVQENEKFKNLISQTFKQKNIDINLYLWEKSSCSFPGIRRYAGSSEISAYRKRFQISSIEDALDLDDNDFPKHLWSFIFQNKPFGKKGPEGYSLAHLIDHKKYNNRMEEEFIFPDNYVFEKPLYGLYTCPTNTVYIPNNLIKPTDFNGNLRNLLFRKAYSLYNSVCNIIPPEIKIKENPDHKWDLDNFEWAEPVGTLDNIQNFLDYRKKIFTELLK